jgi:hypothetical protein
LVETCSSMHVEIGLLGMKLAKVQVWRRNIRSDRFRNRKRKSSFFEIMLEFNQQYWWGQRAETQIYGGSIANGGCTHSGLAVSKTYDWRYQFGELTCIGECASGLLNQLELSCFDAF